MPPMLHTWTGPSGIERVMSGRRDLYLTQGGIQGMGFPEIVHHRRERMGHGSRWSGWRAGERDVAWPVHIHGGDLNDPQRWVQLDRDFWDDLRPGAAGIWAVTNPVTGERFELECRVRGDGGLSIVRDPYVFGRLGYGVELDGAPFWLGETVRKRWENPKPLPERILRTNRIMNPSFETGVAGVLAGSATTVSTAGGPSAASGGRLLVATLTSATTGSAYVAQRFTLPPGTGGQWVAFSAGVRRIATGVGATHARLYISLDNGTNLFGPYVALASGMRRQSLALQLPEGVTQATCWVRYAGSADGAAPADGDTWSDAWMGCVAPTEAEALDQAGLELMPYFDGDTPASGGVQYRWTGGAGSSAAEEFQPAETVAGGPWLASPRGVMRFTSGRVLGSTVVTNPGDEEAFPEWLVEGPASQWVVGVGTARISSTRTLLAGESRRIVTANGRMRVFDQAGRYVPLSELDGVRAAPIPTGQDVRLSVDLVGDGAITVTFRVPRLRVVS